MKFKCNGAVSFENHRSQTSVLLFNLRYCLKHTPVGCRGVSYVVGIVVQLKWMFSLVFSPRDPLSSSEYIKAKCKESRHLFVQENEQRRIQTKILSVE